MCVPQVAEGLNDTAENLMAAIASDEPEVSPSTLYATACILEGAPFINGSPQNTFVPGLIELAVANNVLIGGDDFKSGQVSTSRAAGRCWWRAPGSSWLETHNPQSAAPPQVAAAGGCASNRALLGC